MLKKTSDPQERERLRASVVLITDEDRIRDLEKRIDIVIAAYYGLSRPFKAIVVDQITTGMISEIIRAAITKKYTEGGWKIAFDDTLSIITLE